MGLGVLIEKGVGELEGRLADGGLGSADRAAVATEVGTSKDCDASVDGAGEISETVV